MADPVVYLLLASFALGAALNKHGVDSRIALVLSECPRNGYLVCAERCAY